MLGVFDSGCLDAHAHVRCNTPMRPLFAEQLPVSLGLPIPGEVDYTPSNDGATPRGSAAVYAEPLFQPTIAGVVATAVWYPNHLVVSVETGGDVSATTLESLRRVCKQMKASRDMVTLRIRNQSAVVLEERVA